MKKVSGFTFIKNGLSLGYPILESIQSITPLCDEIIINIGFDDPDLCKDDGTQEYLKDNLKGEKYKFLKSWWDPSKSSRGLILSEQTNIALEKCSGEVCQYIQGDEVIHEEDLPKIENGIRDLFDRKELQALVFNYLHFFGNVDIYKYTRSIYRREVRTIKNGIGLKSFLDAQGFRFEDETKPLAKLIDARIFHYGWARKESVMAKKIEKMDKLYHGENFEQKSTFEYKKVFGLKKFCETHPLIMSNWIEDHRNELNLDTLQSDFKLKHINLFFSDLFENLTGYRFGEFKNYRLIK
ncbi:MAG: hypothetical protein H6622_04020 [Halobacteriovoraceae bacterium]|nr:hypothetical protein [Halobacteriovoraceae bacterium]